MGATVVGAGEGAEEARVVRERTTGVRERGGAVAVMTVECPGTRNDWEGKSNMGIEGYSDSSVLTL